MVFYFYGKQRYYFDGNYDITQKEQIKIFHLLFFMCGIF